MVSKKGEEVKPKRYVVTSAQASYWEKETERDGVHLVRRDCVAQPNKEFLKGLEKYCSENDAELRIMKMQGKDSREQIMHGDFENIPELYTHEGEERLNSNVAISDLKVPPQNKDPTTGRDVFAQEGMTLVYAHSKQRLKAVPSSNNKLPKLLLTTGAMTHPNYHKSNDRGDVAFRQHQYGAAIIEVIDDNFYNVRHLPAHKNGNFVDMGMKYNQGKKPKMAKTEALVLGDIHLGDHDPKTVQANYEMIEYFKPKKIMLHDLLNGHSVNPHEKDNFIKRIQEWEKGRLILEDELKACNDELKNLSKIAGKGDIYVVASNHPYFVDRYLNAARFVKEPWNAKLGMQLSLAMVDGEDPVEYGLKMMGKLPSNIHFLKLNDDLKSWGYQLASHGHKGSNGARGSARSREIGHGGKSITGHSHSPDVFRNTYVVGTSTALDLDYTVGGSSSWMAANAVLYEGGLVQMLPIIDGKWRSNK